MMSNEMLSFGGFILFIIITLSIDLGIFNKNDHEVGFKEAAIMSAVWVALAIGFYFLLVFEGQRLHEVKNFDQLNQIIKLHKQNIHLVPGNFEKSLDIYKHNLGLEFITGYLVEYALSVDNIFVMVLVFNAFAVKQMYYHRVLIWGIIGALIMRFIFIFVGAALISRFEWITYIFGVFLLYTGVSMFIKSNDDKEIDSENHPVVKFASKYFRVHPQFEGRKFFIKKNHLTYVTPLFIVLLIVEITDLIFAVDSIPAIFSITKDPYIVFFSNIFAILGLRSMFFLLVNVINKFHYLETGLAILLAFIGLEMLAHHWLVQWGFTNIHSLLVIVFILAVSIGASLVFPEREKEAKP